MRSYDIPGSTDDMTLEQARQALNKMHADSMADQEHPYLSSGHPQHRDFADYSTRLYTIIVTAEAEAKAAREAEALEAARDETQGLSPVECLARGRALLRTPGYLDSSLPQAERDQLKKQIDAFYLVACQTEPEPSQEMEIDEDV